MRNLINKTKTGDKDMKVNLYKVFHKKRLIKTYIITSILFLFMIGAIYYDYASSTAAAVQEGISESLIRFHVRANSDSKSDQALKLKVKDKVIESMSELLSESESIDETRELLINNIDNIRQIAKGEIVANGESYDVNVKVDFEEFPLKTYGDIVLPPGKYEALVVEIGEAKGKNWWCVMFPPLCFVDATHGVVPDASKEQLKGVLSDEEYLTVLRTETSDNLPIKIKFKLFSWFDKDKEKESKVFVKLFGK